MMVFRRLSPPLKSNPGRAAALSLALSAVCWSAQAQTSNALQAADPATPATTSAPLLLPPTGSAAALERPADIARAREIWQRANERVAEFPRGHIDLLRWEAANMPRPAGATATPAAAPLDLAEALRTSLRQRPDLFTHAGMNALAMARVRVAYAAHVRDLQHAWIDAVALQQRARHMASVLDASRTGSELGARMVRAGNWSQARLMREQLGEATAWQAAADAALAARGATERLARLLGLWRGADVDALARRLPAALPALPLQPAPGEGLTEAGIEAAALRSHPLLAMAVADTQRAVDALAPGRWAAWEAATEAALQALPDPAGAQPAPPHIGSLTLLRDEKLEHAAEQQAALLQRAAARRAMARQAWTDVRARHAGAQHAEQVVTELQNALKQESLLRYNGMLESSWQLLGSARERIQALDAALMARRGYWRAQASWQAVLAGADYTGGEAAMAGTAAASNGAEGH